MYQHIKVPSQGQKITVNKDYSLNVPDQPIVPFIEGDGTGVDITPVMIKVVDAAVAKAYGGRRRIVWMELFAGEKSTRVYGPDVWLPEETLAALREYVVSIKGPLTTPVGGGIRSINVALRQELDLYVCLRPVRYFKGVPSPLKQPEKTDMVIFRKNSEDIYAGIEYEAETDKAKKLIKFLQNEMGVKKIRFPATSGIGIKPFSREGTERLVRKAIQYAIDNRRKSLTFVHKGDIMKITEGAFARWGYGSWETNQTAEDTMRFSLELDSEYASFFVSAPLPGTRFFDYACQQGLFEKGGDDMFRWFADAYFRPVVRGHFLGKAEIEKLRRKALKRYLLRPGYLSRNLKRVRSGNFSGTLLPLFP